MDTNLLSHLLTKAAASPNVELRKLANELLGQLPPPVPAQGVVNSDPAETLDVGLVSNDKGTDNLEGAILSGAFPELDSKGSTPQPQSVKVGTTLWHTLVNKHGNQHRRTNPS